jgi:UDPglucose 6-dehydrogenase
MSNKVAVVGVGKLGLPLSVVIASAGHEVVAVDVNRNRIDDLKFHGYTGPEPEVQALLQENRDKIQLSNNFRDILECEIAYVIVPTPSDQTDMFTCEYVLASVEELANIWKESRANHTVVIVSTVMPETCKNLLSPFMQSKLGEKSEGVVNLIYSPEFIALGTVVENLRNPDVILVGAEKPSDARLHIEIMKSIVTTEPEVQILTLTEAELVKLLINTFITMKISFANYIAELTDHFLGNPSDVARAVGMDSRIGVKYLKPGMAFGGPCFPRDNKAIIALSRSVNLVANLAIGTDEINDRQAIKVMHRITKGMNVGDQVLVIGLTYKFGSEVVEASQGIALANALYDHGYNVSTYDALLPSAPDKLNSAIPFLSDITKPSPFQLVVNTNNSPIDFIKDIPNSKYIKY